jgi:hypothetical protein
MQRATYTRTPSQSWAISHGLSHMPRRQVSYSLQHATCNTKMQQVCTPYATSSTRAKCAAHVATCTTHHATKNVPRATPCNTRNCRQRGLRTASERAMLPPLNATDPPDIITTPPLCTPPPPSASDRIGLPSRSHLFCHGSGDRHILECRAAAGHVYDTTLGSLHTSAGDGRSVTTTAFHSHDATCGAHYATK